MASNFRSNPLPIFQFSHFSSTASIFVLTSSHRHHIGFPSSFGVLVFIVPSFVGWCGLYPGTEMWLGEEDCFPFLACQHSRWNSLFILCMLSALRCSWLPIKKLLRFPSLFFKSMGGFNSFYLFWVLIKFKIGWVWAIRDFVVYFYSVVLFTGLIYGFQKINTLRQCVEFSLCFGQVFFLTEFINIVLFLTIRPFNFLMANYYYAICCSKED